MNGTFLRLMAGVALSSLAMYANTTLSNFADPNGAVAPYTANINSSPATSYIICDDDVQGDNGGDGTFNEESLYTAINSSPALSGLRFASVGTTVYEEAAWLVLQELYYNAPGANNNSTYVNALQYAIWDIMDVGHTLEYAIPTSGTVFTDMNTFLCDVGVGSGCSSNFTTGGASSRYNTVINDDKNIFILTPTASGNQEFWTVTSTPEPATFAFMGLGLVLLSLGTFRRLKKNS